MVIPLNTRKQYHRRNRVGLTLNYATLLPINFRFNIHSYQKDYIGHIVNGQLIRIICELKLYLIYISFYLCYNNII